MRPANKRGRYIVTSSLIGWAHTQNDPCYMPHIRDNKQKKMQIYIFMVSKSNSACEELTLKKQ